MKQSLWEELRWFRTHGCNLDRDSEHGFYNTELQQPGEGLGLQNHLLLSSSQTTVFLSLSERPVTAENVNQMCEEEEEHTALVQTTLTVWHFCSHQMWCELLKKRLSRSVYRTHFLTPGSTFSSGQTLWSEKVFKCAKVPSVTHLCSHFNQHEQFFYADE